MTKQELIHASELLTWSRELDENKISFAEFQNQVKKSKRKLKIIQPNYERIRGGDACT